MKTTRVLAPRASAVLSASIAAILANVPAAQAQTTDTWSLGSSGLWNVAGNWSAGLPGASSNVDIIDGTSTVTLNINAGINDLTVGSGNTLSFDVGSGLAIAGPTISNKGTIQINGGAGYNTYLSLADNVTLSGSGTLTLATAAGGGTAGILQSASGLTLTNQSTIQGAGTIGNSGLTLANSGTIDGNSSAAGGLLLNGASVTNTGLIEASSGGALTLNTTVVNTGAGTITSSGAGSVVDLINSSITGGTLTASGGGAFNPTGTNTLTGVTISSGTIYPVNGGTVTNLTAPITNNGTIQINGGAGYNAVLQIGTNVTLAGTVTLATATGGGNADLQQSQNGLTLTTTGTVQGAGIVGNGGMALVNSGTIDANTSAGTAGLLLDGSGGVANTGKLEATNGGTLTLNTTVVNTGAGAIITASGAGSVVNLDNANITGGTLTASGGGTFDPVGSDTLAGVTISSGTIYPVTGGNVTYLTSPITNKGTIEINGGAGYNALLEIASNLTLGGTVTLATATGGGNADLQQSVNGVTLTTTGTVQGTGIIGNGGLTLVNSGTIEANTTSGTAGLLLNGAGITNTGTLEATNGGALTLNTAVANTGGNITASGSGSVVNLVNASITGGTLNASSGGTFNPSGSDTLTGVTISAGTIYPVPGANVTYLNGPITNNGTIQINGGAGNNAVLEIASNVTLGGTVTLATAAGGGVAYIQQSVSGVTLTNAGTTQGSGVIGNGSLALVNETKAVIDANVTGTGIPMELTLNGSGGITNSGLLEATNGNTLQIQASVANTNGNITASGTNSVVSLDGATVTGGTFNTSGGGAISANSSTTLNGVTISAGSTLTAADNSATYLSGTTTNDGTILISGGAGANVEVILNNNVTLTGGGKVTIATASGGGNSYIEAAANGLTLTNTNNTIQGNGIIGNGPLTVVNSAGGTISSDVSGSSLVLNGSGGLTNSGTLQVSTGALLQVTSGPFTNFSGTTLTGGTYNVSGTLEIDELGTTGGEIVTDAANITLDGTAAKFVDADGNSALTDLATIAAKSSFALAGDADFTTAGNFTNKGTLTVGAGSVFLVHGRLLNFSSTTDTLTAGTYDLTGKLEFAGANIETNDAAIELIGKTAAIINTTTKKNGLANFATNESAGRFTLAGAADVTTAGSFSNAGTVTIASSTATLDIGGAGVYTQTAGTTTDSGTLSASGGVDLTGGSLFGGGTITGNLQSSGIVTPGASATKTGILTDTGTYTQNSGGTLDIGIGGTTAGTNFDAVKATTAALSGTLNISELNGFVPTVGSTFKILNFNSVTGTFTTVNGLTINSTEAYTITYQGTDVLLTVVSTAAAPAARTADAQVERGFRVEDKQGVESGDASRLSAALRDFNAAHAVGGRAAGLNNEALSRPRIQERIRAIDLVKLAKR